MEAEVLRVKDEDTGIEVRIPIKTKYTFIGNNSGIGKTIFYDMLGYKENITIEFPYKVRRLPEDREIMRRAQKFESLSNEYLYVLINDFGNTPKLLIADEDSDYTRSFAFQHAMLQSPHLLLMLTRKPFLIIPESYKNIAEIEIGKAE